MAALSTVVEWYDFTLYLYFATVVARVFFGGGSAALATALGGFALAYLMRPIGAVVFGHIADRHGRRPMLLLSMALMSLAMLLTALLPTYAQISRHGAGGYRSSSAPRLRAPFGWRDGDSRNRPIGSGCAPTADL